MQLAGARTVVTGAARGIGLAIARRFCREGARVVASDRDAEALAAAVAELQRLGDAVGFVADVSTEPANAALVEFARSHLGEVDLFFANAGIMGLTRSLAREWGPFGIRVNALAPGWVMTPRQRDLWVTPDSLAAHLDKQCLKEEILPEDIVAPTLFLASRAARMMTGQTIAVDGGVVGTGG